MNKVKLLMLITIIFPISKGLAQNEDSRIIKGIISNENFEPLSSVNIFSVKTGIGTLSANDGSFMFRLQETDSLKISAIGYKTKLVAASNLNKEKNYIVLTLQVYLLDDITILGYGNWIEFKHEFMNKNLKPMEQKILVIKGLPNPYQVLVPNNTLSTNPITMIYQLFNRKAVMERKQKRWNKKYNESWIEYRKK